MYKMVGRLMMKNKQISKECLKKLIMKKVCWPQRYIWWMDGSKT
jgi:hypothetical protein